MLRSIHLVFNMIIPKNLTILFIILYLSQIVKAVDDKGKETEKRKAEETVGKEQHGKKIKLEIGGKYLIILFY